MMRSISFGLVRATNAYTWFTPGTAKLFESKIAKIIMRSMIAIKTLQKILDKQPMSSVIGSIIGQRLAFMYLDPIRFRITKTYFAVQRANIFNTMSVRTWIDPSIDADRNGRIIKNMVIIYHDANRAGKHVDIHIGHLSLIMRLSGKPVEGKIKFNNKGELTQDSKDAILDHVRQEIFNHSRVPQNLDHDIANAKCVWRIGEKGIAGYGSGTTRQIVLEDKVEFYHTHLQSSLHMYAPAITPHQGLYLYKIYNGETTGVPICIWGALIPRDDKFQDRLHLNMIQEVDFERFKTVTDESTTTRKYDGASTHFGTTGEGFKFFSPRYSKTTGHRIEYTYKLPELAEWGFGSILPDRVSHTQGMGEVLFWRRTNAGKITKALFGIRGPENWCWKYLSAAEIGGVLNSHQVRATNIIPEVRMYRMDRFNQQDVINLSFHDNRKLQQQVVKVNEYFKVVDIVRPIINRGDNYEGYVAVPEGTNINEGYKYKFKGDEIDMTITSIDLYLSEKQNISGTILCTYNGKEYKFGPGSIGNVETCLDFINNKEKFVGRTVKTAGFRGHEGRAAKLIDWHMDKGRA